MRSPIFTKRGGIKSQDCALKDVVVVRVVEVEVVVVDVKVVVVEVKAVAIGLKVVEAVNVAEVEARR